MSALSPTARRRAAAGGVIGFRLPEQPRSVLVERARRLQTSEHSLAREYTLLALAGGGTSECLAAMEALASMLVVLHKDLRAVTEVMLSHGGKLTREQAIAWTDKNLPPICSPSPNP